MSKKTLNKANLEALGADRLAELLIEVSTGSADIKRRLRLELSHNLGPEELARDVRKRLVSIRRSKSFVGWRKRKALVKDLGTQAEMITAKIAPDAPTEAFELLWQFIELAPSVFERTDDSRGEIAEVFHTARTHFADIAPNAVLDPIDLARRVWDAVQANDYGEFDGIIGLLAPAMGADGLAHLKTLVLAHKDRPLNEGEDHAALQFLRDLRGTRGSPAATRKARLIKASLQDIATAQGDTDTFIAQYTKHDLARPRIAAEVAKLLLDAGRPQDALDRLEAAPPEPHDAAVADWDTAYITSLLALDRLADAQHHRWERFCETLAPQMLRDYLKVLPDFDDIDAEDAAKAHALTVEDPMAALRFFLAWPDIAMAARLIEERANTMDGDQTETLTAAADALRGRYPLAAVLAWRAMIDYVLWYGQSARYGHIADHLMDCAAADQDIDDYGTYPSHQAYLDALQRQYKQKTSFWTRVF